MATISKKEVKRALTLNIYRRAMDIYDELLKRGESESNIYVFKACCLYALCQYKEAKAEAEKAVEDNPLKMRLLF